MNESPWLTKAEVASRAQVSVRTVERAIATGKLLAARPGRNTVVVHVDELDAWLERRRVRDRRLA